MLLLVQGTPDGPLLWVLTVAVVVGAGAAIAAAAAAWTLLGRMGEVAGHAAALDRLEDLSREVSALSKGRGDLDLRRIEHVLIELRDAQVRLEDVLLRHAEAARVAQAGGGGTALAPAAVSEDLGERAINRLLAMGYERIQLVTRAEKLAELASKDGEILVEARKEGVLHKGRVLIRAGRIVNVELHPAYSIFP